MKIRKLKTFLIILLSLFLTSSGGLYSAKTATLLISAEALGAVEITAATTGADAIFANICNGEPDTAYKIGIITVHSPVSNYTVTATSANLGYLKDTDTPNANQIAYTVEIADTADIVSTGYQSLATSATLISSSPLTVSALTLDVYLKFTTDPYMVTVGYGPYTDTITFTIAVV